jgi:hypothetical protein
MRRSKRCRASGLRIRLVFALALGLGLHAGAAEAWIYIGWAPVAAGTTADDTGYGAVDYDYRIGRHEVNNHQYAVFLNAVAATDTNGLFNASTEPFGGIARSGSSGSYTYAAKPGFEDKPVVYVSYWNSHRFANWLHNQQPKGMQDATTTEGGAYTITPAGIAANSITRNEGARVFVTSEDEWYRAAYYDAVSASYFDYPIGTDVETSCATPAGDTGNSANCGEAVGAPTDSRSYPLSGSPSGTFDQGGNVWEWSETIIDGSHRRIRGGSYSQPPSALAVGAPSSMLPGNDSSIVGFRIAAQPRGDVPSLSPAGLLVTAGLLMTAGLLGLAGYRRGRS